MKIIIFGASGSGTSTLAKTLAERTGYQHLDIDNYYWKPTDPPYQEKIPLEERNARLTNDFKRQEQLMVSGSLVSWGPAWLSAFDLAVFLYLPPAVRMERLRKREVDRYGSRLYTDTTIINNSRAFLDWADCYDDPDFSGRSLHIHEQWIQQLECPVLRLEDAPELEEKVERVLAKMSILSGENTRS